MLSLVILGFTRLNFVFFWLSLSYHGLLGLTRLISQFLVNVFAILGFSQFNYVSFLVNFYSVYIQFKLIEDRLVLTNTAQNMKFSIKVSLVNVTKSAVSCRFSHIY